VILICHILITVGALSGKNGTEIVTLDTEEHGLVTATEMRSYNPANGLVVRACEILSVMLQ